MMSDYLRVGMIADSSGNLIELRLPLADTGTAFTRRYKLPDSFKDVERMRIRLDAMVDECKEKLKELLLLKIPSELQGLVSQLKRARPGGLIQLLRGMEHLVESGGGREFEGAVEVLRRWLERNDQLRRLHSDTQGRLIGRRRWLNGNCAAWLSRRYDKIIWEGDLSISGLPGRIERSVNKYALDHSRKYQSHAAVGELRQIIRRAVAKRGGELIGGRRAYSTITCAKCGSRCEPNDRIAIRCPQGHEFNQDVNAAENLLAGAEVLLDNSREPLVIPETLRSVLVPLVDL